MPSDDAASAPPHADVLRHAARPHRRPTAPPARWRRVTTTARSVRRV
ncbi:hypothetical protein [Micromonospora wenchangensis]